MTRIHEALVIGGGPAGAAVARHLASAGRDVVLVEREAGAHDKVCGEFLSSEAILYLRDLGIEPEQLGAIPIRTVALAAGGEPVSCDLPFRALSLSRRRLDEELLQAARSAGVHVRRGVRVKALEPVSGTWLARLESGEALCGRQAFLATGKHDLRGWKRPPGGQDDLIGFKLYFRLSAVQAAALEGRVELAVFPGGYAGLEPVEGGRANLCLVVRASSYAALGHRWDALLGLIRSACPHFAKRLRGAEPIHNRPLAIAAIPYGLVQRPADGVWRIGDQAAVIPSFAGEGMSIALHSARLAAECYLRGETAQDFQGRLATDVASQVRHATFLSRLLVNRWSQKAITGGARFLPDVLASVASMTRIPTSALRSAGLGPM